MKDQIIIIGGGAAGFFAALRAKTQNPALRVILLEAARKPLGKVKISGGGRCNVTHACFDLERFAQHYPRGQREMKGILSRFGPQDTVNWFESHGVKLKAEADGRMFPITDDSQTIVDCLLRAAQQAGVELHLETPVQQIQRYATGFKVQTGDKTFEADALVLATGSSSRGYEWAKSLGNHIVEPVPSLFTFNIRDSLLTDLAGISFPMVKATLTVPEAKPIQQEGPLLITHWGLSGPVVLRLSAWGARMLQHKQYRGKLTVDLLPALSQESIQALLQAQKQKTPKRQVGNECPLDLPKRFWQRLLALEELPIEKPWAEVPQKALNRLGERLKRCELQIQGKGVFKEEFVTAGGVPLKEIDLKTMESRCCPGLYLAGEVIDIDGLTGGFNFQNAWATGWIAGTALAEAAKP